MGFRAAAGVIAVNYGLKLWQAESVLLDELLFAYSQFTKGGAA